MSEQELLYKILDEVGKANTKIAVIETKQDVHIKSQTELLESHNEISKSHYKLKNDFTNHKTRFVWLSGILGSIFGAIGTFIWNVLFGK